MTVERFAVSAAMSVFGLILGLAFLAILKTRGYDPVERVSSVFAPTLATGGNQ